MVDGADAEAACRKCGAGKYSGSLGASTENACISCSAGKYSAAQGARSGSTCIACGAGKYSGSSGARSISTCLACDEGKYSGALRATSADTCEACGAGKYSGKVGAASEATCQKCGAGKYSTATGASSGSTCKSCRAGKYLAEEGATSEMFCVDCGTGTYSPSLGATGRTTCQTCGAGKYLATTGNDAEEDCMLCEQGLYSIRNASSQCLACVAGKFSSAVGSNSSTSCQDCSVGKFSAYDGATTCMVTTVVSSITVKPSANDIVVPVTFGLPISLAEFDASKQRDFRQSIAYATDVSIQRVIIVKVESITARTRLRRLLADGIMVKVEVQVTDQQMAESVKAKLTSDNLNKEFERAGLPRAEVLSTAKTSLQITSDQAGVSADVLGIIVGIAAAGICLPVLLTSLISRWRRRSLSHGLQPNKDRISRNARNMGLNVTPPRVDNQWDEMVLIESVSSTKAVGDTPLTAPRGILQTSRAVSPQGSISDEQAPCRCTGEPETIHSNVKGDEAAPTELNSQQMLEGETSEAGRLAEQHAASAWFKSSNQSPLSYRTTGTLPLHPWHVQRGSEVSFIIVLAIFNSPV